MELYYVLSIGILIGILTYSLTFFGKIDYYKRIIVLIATSVILVVGGLLIGGFGGMPISMIGAGVLAVAFLLFLLEKTPILRSVVLVVLLVGSTYFVLLLF